MIHSMTAFTRIQTQGEWGSLVCEMRSINHRFLEINLHLPEMLRGLEMQVRELIREHLKRGKIECNIRYQPGNDETSFFTVNASLVKEISRASDEVANIFRNASAPSPIDILKFPGVLETKEGDFEVLQNQLHQLLEKALADLIAARAREGEELKQLFLQRTQLMREELAKVRQRLPQVIEEQQERLKKRFADAKVELDPTRLEQEMVIFAQKLDVAEEIDRTETHINEIHRILKQGGASGRRLDFLMQELNREANTLGSKSSDSIVTHAAVELKVLIEQMREQVQNIE